MNRMRTFAGRVVREESFHVHRIESIRTLAELAGDRHGSMLPEHVTHFILSERPQEIGYPSLIAATLELNG